MPGLLETAKDELREGGLSKAVPRRARYAGNVVERYAAWCAAALATTLVLAIA